MKDSASDGECRVMPSCPMRRLARVFFPTPPVPMLRFRISSRACCNSPTRSGLLRAAKYFETACRPEARMPPVIRSARFARILLYCALTIRIPAKIRCTSTATWTMGPERIHKPIPFLMNPAASAPACSAFKRRTSLRRMSSTPQPWDTRARVGSLLSFRRRRFHRI